jgi:predicted RNase H-like nuclease (RuvC/YqgF family)
VGIFPERFNGISWIKRKLKKKDYTDLHKIKILFTSNIEEHKELFEHRILLCDEKYIKELSGCAYISADDLEIAKKEAEELKYELTKVDKKKLMDIIESYRSERI